MKIFRFQVSENVRKFRLDDFLFKRIGALSKMYLRRLINQEKCLVDGIPQKPGYHLKLGETVEVEVDLSAVTSMKPESIPLEILFEDEDIIVVNKPAGMLVHPTLGVKSGTLLNALAFHFNKSLESGVERLESNAEDSQLQTPDSQLFIRPGLIHRLDKQTSGLMVIAKNKRANRILSDHFRRKIVEKKYFALVEGIVEKESGEINALVGQDETLKLWRVMENGKSAQTRFQVIERRTETTLLELEPVTGRTNQLRAHCEFINHPIVGDTDRGGREFSRLCLHAAKLKFFHPNGGTGKMSFETDLPEEMRG